MSDIANTLTQADIQAFQNAFKKHFGTQLDDSTAKRKLTQLVRLTELIYKPAPEVQQNGGDQ